MPPCNMYSFVLPMLIFASTVVRPTQGSFWHTNQTRLDPLTADVLGPVSAKSAVYCIRYCINLEIHFFVFYFVEDTQSCYCSKELDTRPENLSVPVITYGYQIVSRDCLDIYERGDRQDATFLIEPNPGSLATAWCDLTNGGWTVIQRRQDGSVDFDRNWSDYAAGFGDPSGEYWLGLDSIHYLTQNTTVLHIYMQTFGDVSPVDGFVTYSNFSVANSSMKYRLSLQGYEGSVPDSMLAMENGMMFSTYDNDNDNWAGASCVDLYKGAWWYNACHYSNLNGQYLSGVHTTYANGINWVDPWGFYYSLKQTIMKVKRVQRTSDYLKF